MQPKLYAYRFFIKLFKYTNNNPVHRQKSVGLFYLKKTNAFFCQKKENCELKVYCM